MNATLSWEGTHDVTSASLLTELTVGCLLYGMSRRIAEEANRARTPNAIEASRTPAAIAPNGRTTRPSILNRVGAYLVMPQMVRLSHHPCLHNGAIKVFLLVLFHC